MDVFIDSAARMSYFWWERDMLVLDVYFWKYDKLTGPS